MSKLKEPEIARKMKENENRNARKFGKTEVIIGYFKENEETRKRWELQKRLENWERLVSSTVEVIGTF